MDNKIVSALIKTYNGDEIEAEGVLSDCGTVCAVAIARPGNPMYKSNGTKLPSRTTAYGDLCVYSYDTVNSKIGMSIMKSVSWQIIQIKTKQNTENDPFMKSPFDVKMRPANQDDNTRPAEFSMDIRKLCTEAIRHAINNLHDDIVNNRSSLRSSELAEIADKSVEIAKLLIAKRAGSSDSPAQHVIPDGTRRTVADIMN